MDVKKQVLCTYTTENLVNNLNLLVQDWNIGLLVHKGIFILKKDYKA